MLCCSAARLGRFFLQSSGITKLLSFIHLPSLEAAGIDHSVGHSLVPRKFCLSFVINPLTRQGDWKGFSFRISHFSGEQILSCFLGQFVYLTNSRDNYLGIYILHLLLFSFHTLKTSSFWSSDCCREYPRQLQTISSPGCLLCSCELRASYKTSLRSVQLNGLL